MNVVCYFAFYGLYYNVKFNIKRFVKRLLFPDKLFNLLLFTFK
jgi:hypothetical protein